MKNTTVEKKRGNWLLWLILVIYVLVLFLSSYGIDALGILMFPVALLFAIFHAARKYGWKAAAVFILISVVVSLIYENLSIATGFPFGWYHWSREKNPGPFIGTVPLLTAIAYCGTGYISWMLATILVGEPHQEENQSPAIITPFIAAFIMVMWDMSMDPMASTVYGVWVWHHGGGYYGVPLSNFLGWYLVVYTIYQLFAVFLRFNRGAIRSISNRGYWWQVIVFYFFIGLSNLLPSQFTDKTIVTDLAGRKWVVGNIYEGMLMVAIFTMGFVCVLAGVRVYRSGGRPGML